MLIVPESKLVIRASCSEDFALLLEGNWFLCLDLEPRWAHDPLSVLALLSREDLFVVL